MLIWKRMTVIQCYCDTMLGFTNESMKQLKGMAPYKGLLLALRCALGFLKGIFAI